MPPFFVRFGSRGDLLICSAILATHILPNVALFKYPNAEILALLEY